MTELLFIQLNLSDANDVKQDCQNLVGSLSQIKLNAVKKAEE